LAKPTLKIGLTGGIASGKTTVCQLFAQHGITIIDADIIARELVEIDQPALAEISNLFGSQILHEDGQLNRARLHHIIFEDQKDRQQLEAILHPKIRLEITRQLAQQHNAYCIVAIPLLIEAKMCDLVDRVLVIDIKEELQINRLMARDNITATTAQTMIASQCSNEQRLSFADDIIINNQSIAPLTKQVNKLAEKYTHLANSCHDDDSHGQ